MIHVDDHLLNQIMDVAKKKADRLKLAKVDSMDDVLWFLQVWWCKFHKRPIKDPLLQDYTLEDLAFEFYLFTEQDADKTTSNMIKGNEKELASMFDDILPAENISADDQKFMAENFPNQWTMGESDFA